VAAPRPEVVPSPRPEEAPLGLATPAPSIRRTPRLLWVAVPVVLVAIVWALSGPIGERPEASRGEPPPAASAESEDQPQPAGQPAGKPRAGTKPFFNATAGYGFRYPRSWSVSSNGEVAKVISPDRTEVVSFALGPVGLPATYESFAALLRDSYRSVAFSRHRSASVEGNPAVRVSGRAVNTSGTRLRFRALLVERPGERSVGVFAATRAGGPPSRGALSVLDSLHFAASA
jgi:hypothetical protein